MKEEVKYTVGELLSFAFTLVVIGIAVAYGMDITKDVGNDLCGDTSLHHTGGANWTGRCFVCPNSTYDNYFTVDNTCGNYSGAYIDSINTVNVSAVPGGSVAYNATADSITGVGNVTEKLPTIATVVVASVIIGILLTYLYARFAKM